MRVCVCGPKACLTEAGEAARSTGALCFGSPPRGSKTVGCLHWPGHPDVDGRDAQRMGQRFRAGRESTLREDSQVGNETVTVLSGA